jgi:hypothetical protein
MTNVALGFRVHTGWAAAIVIAMPAGSPEALDRRRLDLTSPGMPVQVFHASRSLDPDEANQLVEQASGAAWAVAREAVSTFVNELRTAGHELVGSGVILGTGFNFTDSLSHAGAHAAEGGMYRQAIIQASETCGLTVLGIPERDLFTRASVLLKLPVDSIHQRLKDLGRPLGAPWGQDQKAATLAAWLALVSAAFATP